MISVVFFDNGRDKTGWVIVFSVTSSGFEFRLVGSIGKRFLYERENLGV